MKIALEDISFYYGEKEIIQNCSIEIASGETMALLGASGCGKSTLLKVIAGLLDSSKGRILFNDKERTKEERIASYLSESRLFPWLSISQNLQLTGRKKMVQQYLEQLNLTAFSDYYPHALSAGMQQKIQLARLAMQTSDIWLLDEPFNGLDIQSKEVVYDFLNVLKKGRTVVFVTHNIPEAVTFSDRIAIWDTKKRRPETILRNEGNVEETLRLLLLQSLKTGDFPW